MKFNKIIFILALCFFFGVNAQSSQYKSERDKINNLVHTKLDVKFDIPNSLLHGEAWITLTPHFNSTSKVTLDAKGMLIHSVTVNGSKAPCNYFENKELIIELDKAYEKGENFSVYIKYTSQPEKVVKMGVTNQKGLHFIDPKGNDENKPTQIWTEGEPESNSVWFPTIDAPNQKSTQEISMTVPKEFVTLSNGTLINQQENASGTRTDTWKQDQKHAPYLFFMAAGEFSVVKDTWKGKSVEYFVEKKYEDVARAIFGKTPRMLQFFEDLLGVEYPWDKYSQIVVQDYISGAMENTTAVSHSASAYQDKGELIDENSWEYVIAHEVFHHWFGDLVTSESWANLTMNEAFANYGEYLWFEHEYGKEYADEYQSRLNQKYFRGGEKSKQKDLIRFNYDSPDDMFDAVTYEKGGAILHMLRNYLGDKAFFAGLKKYLVDNRFGTAEGHQLRLALEEVSGKDLNWFFNQWFYNNGHPTLQVKQRVGQFGQKVTIDIVQDENVFEFPLTIDVYEESGKASHTVWVDGQHRSFEFPISSKLNLVVVEPTGTLLAKIDHEKTLDEMIYQYNHAEGYSNRQNALTYIAKYQDNTKAFKTMSKALNDSFFKLQIFALNNLDLKNKYAKGAAIKTVENLAKNSDKTLVQAAANITLAKLVDPKYIPHFEKAMSSKSFKVIESAVIALYQLDRQKTLQKVDLLPENTKEHLSDVLAGYYLENRGDKYMVYLSKHILRGMYSQDAKVVNTYKSAFQWVAKSDNKEAISNLVDSFVKSGIQYKKYGADIAATNFLRQMVDIQRKTENADKKELEIIIRTGMAKLLNK